MGSKIQRFWHPVAVRTATRRAAIAQSLQFFSTRHSSQTGGLTTITEVWEKMAAPCPKWPAAKVSRGPHLLIESVKSLRR
eukprot:symbB.v1.2.017024.t1/scaffold1285.1/size129168/3